MRRFWFVAAMAVFCSILSFSVSSQPAEAPYVLVLGTAQDGGYPQAGCNHPHCEPGWEDPGRRRFPTSLALVDPVSGQRWLFEATPALPDQLRMLDRAAAAASPGLEGVFLTHAHIGHYAGLIHLGREVMGTKGVPVFVMPRMADFLRGNGPWSQLVALRNIDLRPLEDGEPIRLNDRLSVTPFLVPHRDEFSETVGFRIDGPNRSAVFIPDIDKWERWKTDIEDVVRSVDLAWLDGTFYQDGEIPGRSMADIPHPFILESMKQFEPLSGDEKKAIRFIHLNHTNPALQEGSPEWEAVRDNGYAIAEQGERFDL